jgi:phosphatidylglycerophosphate synthase
MLERQRRDILAVVGAAADAAEAHHRTDIDTAGRHRLDLGADVEIGFLLAGDAGDEVLPYTTQIGLALLWISALVTMYTGYDYFRAGIHHLIEEDSR